jgi:hypothetical protein
MALNPNAPLYPEADTSLLQNGAEAILTVPSAPYSSPDFQVPNDQIQPEVDISLLPGVPNQRGPRGFSGDAAFFVAFYDSPSLLLAAHPTPPKMSAWAYSKDPTSTTNIWLYYADTNGAWARTGVPVIEGQQGPVGPTPTIAYTFTQNAVSSNWSITHNLGFYPNVTTVDATKLIIEGTVTYTDINSLTISFGIATTGYAYLS